jgi:hypothetical protein
VLDVLEVTCFSKLITHLNSLSEHTLTSRGSKASPSMIFSVSKSFLHACTTVFRHLMQQVCLPMCYKHSVAPRLRRPDKQCDDYRRLSATVRVAMVSRVLQSSHLIQQPRARRVERENRVFVLSKVFDQRNGANNAIVCYRSPSH